MLTSTLDLPRACLIAGTIVATGAIGFTPTAAHAGDVARIAAPPGVRATPLPMPKDLLASELPPPLYLGPAKSNVFFLNYDGVTIKYTGAFDDSSMDISVFQNLAVAYAPYGEGAKRAASLQAVKTDWAKYNVVITDTRPGGDYLMGVFSPTNPVGGGVLGIAPLDCADKYARNIVFAYHGVNDQYSAATHAATMSQEIAHSFGLEHSNDKADIMYPTSLGTDPSFVNKCVPLNGQVVCDKQHDEFCGGTGQNSDAELIALFGLSSPDMSPPTVKITSPADGQMFVVGSDFPITVEASDDVGVALVELFNNGAPLISFDAEPFTTNTNDIPAGAYCFTATATDLADNKADSAEVCITVSEAGEPDQTTGDVTGDATGDATGDVTGDATGDATTDPTADPPTTSGGESGGDSAGSAGLTGTEGGGSSGDASGGSLPDGGDSALPPGYGEDGGACNVQSRPLPLAGLCLLMLGLLGRRRRAA